VAKDLVSLVDPGHRLSFLNYLARTRRVFSFLTAQFAEIPRLEYVRYLRWAVNQLPDIHFATRIEKVSFGTFFSLHSDGHEIARSDHLVLGIGSRPRVPVGLADLDSIFHAAEVFC
jgi:lysine N6-hydroxylase